MGQFLDETISSRFRYHTGYLNSYVSFIEALEKADGVLVYFYNQFFSSKFLTKTPKSYLEILPFLRKIPSN